MAGSGTVAAVDMVPEVIDRAVVTEEKSSSDPFILTEVSGTPVRNTKLRIGKSGLPAVTNLASK